MSATLQTSQDFTDPKVKRFLRGTSPISLALVGAGIFVLVWALWQSNPADDIFGGVLVLAGCYGTLISRTRRKRFPWMMVGPAVAVLVAVTIVPTIYLILMAVHNVSLIDFTRSWPWAGVRNFVFVVTSSLFIGELVRTLEYVIIAVAVEMVVGTGLAMLAHFHLSHRNVLPTLMILPLMTTPIVNGMIWRWILDFHSGPINALLVRLGAAPQPWLANQPLLAGSLGHWLFLHANGDFAFLVIVFVDIWQWTPFVFLLVLASLRMMSSDVVEAARVDGAQGLLLVRKILLPQIVPVLSVALLLRTMDAFKAFTKIYTLFGASDYTRTFNMAIYNYAFVDSNFGAAAALSVIVLVIVIVLVTLFQRLLRMEET